MSSYNRYEKFKKDGGIEIVPYIEIIKKTTDKYVQFDTSSMRLDRISYEYYGDPNYGWLIMQANPSLGSMEFEIPNGSILRIPYPLDITIQNYIERINYNNKIN